MASIRLRPAEAFSLDAMSAPGVRELIRNDHYWLREHRVVAGASDLAETPGPVVLNVTNGSIALGDLELTRGTTAIVPASSGVSAFEAQNAVVMEMGF